MGFALPADRQHPDVLDPHYAILSAVWNAAPATHIDQSEQVLPPVLDPAPCSVCVNEQRVAPTTAPYDDIADWYEDQFLASQRSRGAGGFADALGIDQAIVELLGRGAGTCLEIGSGTGTHAERVESLGRRPIGIEISAGMLRHARGRLPSAQGDAVHLPFASNSVPAVLSVMVHTDMVDYPAVVTEAHRVLSSGGVFVHVGVHPCFCGGFADRTDPLGIVIRPGYLDGNWTTASWTDQGLRDKVGASHWPLSTLLNTIVGTGLQIQSFSEGAEPTPVVLSLRATKPAIVPPKPQATT